MLELREVKLQQHFTEAPQHLSESELLELMDRHGIGTSVDGVVVPWKNHGKNQEVLPPTPFVENMGMGEEDWVLLVGFLGMSWMWGLEIFGGTKDGLEFFSFVFVGPSIWTNIDFGQIRPKMYAHT